MMKTTTTTLRASTLLAVLSGVACSGMQTLDETTETVVSRLGGTATSPDGQLEVIFLEGAIADGTRVRITVERDLARPSLLSPIYRIGPESLRFTYAMTRLRPNRALDGVREYPYQVRVLDDGSFVPYEGSYWEPGSPAVEGTVVRPGRYAAAAVSLACIDQPCGTACGDGLACDTTRFCVPASAALADCGGEAGDAGVEAPTAPLETLDAGHTCSAVDGSLGCTIAERERNDQTASAQAVNVELGDDVEVFSTFDGGDDWFAFDVPAGGARIDGGAHTSPVTFGCFGVQIQVSVLDAAGTIITTDPGDVWACGRFSFGYPTDEPPLAAGHYYVHVEERAAHTTDKSYFLNLRLDPP